MLHFNQMASSVSSDFSEEDRVSLEDAIEDATAAAERFLKSQKDLHRKLLEVTVDDALSALSLYKDYLMLLDKIPIVKGLSVVPS